MKVIIIGNGISGVSAARFIRKINSNCQITIISAETDYFFSRTALMYVYMGHLRFEDTKPYEDWFWEKNRIDLLRDYVTGFDGTQKQVFLKEKGTLAYDKLILATGSTPNKFGWPGQDLKGVQGLYTHQDLESMEAYSQGLKQAVIVGGGLIGIEMAEMFHSRHIPVTLVVREENYWDNVLPLEEAKMISRHIEENKIELRLATELKEILSDENGRARAIVTNKGEELPCQFVGLTAGVRPNIDFLKNTELELGRGILVNKYLETNIPDVYAIGDCVELKEPKDGRRSIEAVWYTGRMMGETVAYTVCGQKKAYNPGIWFNSAKFLDIEYQVYGAVPNQFPEYMNTLYWEHADGKKSIRINYDKDSEKVLGFNLMGIRYRHEVCEKWLAKETKLEDVLLNLGLANFDPEFYKEYEPDIINLYNQQTGKKLKLKQRRGLAAVLRFLKG